MVFHNLKSRSAVSSVLPRNFITGDNVPGLLKKWVHMRKKQGHCGKNDGTVIWRSKISFLSVCIITDHLSIINSTEKLRYLSTFWDRDSVGASYAIALSVPITSPY